MASPADLSLECKPHGQSMLLQDLLVRLEEERLKIDAFKRELPLCMQLLANAVESSRQQLQVHSKQEAARSRCEASEKADKTRWMSSAQLWSHKDETDTGLRNGGFSKESPNPELGLNKSADDNNNNNNSSQGQATVNNSSNTNRKGRRCWSPDLHRRFVNALQMLGGSQVATPKQIREVMKVDGLTNDEVKSHLQKYRLHSPRGSPSPQPQAAQVVVVGGIWVPSHHYYTASANLPPPQMHHHRSEDGKSESETGGERKGVSNGSEITLKFSN